MNKVYHLTIKKPDSPPQPTTLTLTSPQNRGQCFKCKLAKEIWLISEKTLPSQPNAILEERKFCWTCSLSSLYELEQGNYQIAKKNKKEVIREIRTALKQLIYSSPSETQRVVGDQKDPELLECYA